MRADYKCTIPPGKSGAWYVERFRLTKADIGGVGGFMDAMRDIRVCGEVRSAPLGWYTKLVRVDSRMCTRLCTDTQHVNCLGSPVIMSDTPAELRDLEPLLAHVKGRVLIHGLGLGIAAELCLKMPCVDSVAVVEQSPDVIKLVAPTLTARYGMRLAVYHGDAYKFKPGRFTTPKYDAVWSDIWDNICADNLGGMRKLRTLWAGKAKWHGCWCETQCRRACVVGY